MRFSSNVSGLRRRGGVPGLSIGGLLVLLMVTAAGCDNAKPNASSVRVNTAEVEVVYASQERQPPFLMPGDYDPLWGDIDADAPIIDRLLRAIVGGTPVELGGSAGASKRETVTVKTGWGGGEEEFVAVDGRTWTSDLSLVINIGFRDGTTWSVRQVIGCDVTAEEGFSNCLPVPDHWELLHRNEFVVSKALTEWIGRVEEYMPRVKDYEVPDPIRLGEPLSISGAGYHEGDRVELRIEFFGRECNASRARCCWTMAPFAGTGRFQRRPRRARPTSPCRS